MFAGKITTALSSSACSLYKRQQQQHRRLREDLRCDKMAPRPEEQGYRR